jgi:putative transposase
MPRIARVVVPGVPHHCVQRGNYRQKIFISDHDRTYYLKLINTYSIKYSLEIWAYCLMNNHVHFIVVPSRPESMAKTFNMAHMCYAQYYNNKISQQGHLWQGRFFSCPLDGEHLYEALRYVDRNPVKAGLVKNPEDYPWSSAKAHITNNFKNTILAKSNFNRLEFIDDWNSFLAADEDEMLVKQIESSISTGRPAGSEDFIRRIETITGRKIIAQKGGRPKKAISCKKGGGQK